MRMYRWRATLTASGEYERLNKLKERIRKRKLHRNFTIEKQEWSSVWIGWIDSIWIAKREDRRIDVNLKEQLAKANYSPEKH